MLSSSDVVLVTGATGFTGSWLSRRLCELGCRVKAIARPSSDRSELEDLDIEWIVGDVFDERVIEAAVLDVNYIFHLAAAFREVKVAADVYQKVHVQSTRLLAQNALENRSFKRFVHVSTVGVLGHIDQPPADEATRYNPGDRYQETKAEAEKWILDFSNDTGLPLTVVRPAAIYGPGDRRLLKLFRLAKLKVVPLPGSSRGLYHLIHVEDLTRFMIACSDCEKTLGQVYICGNPEAKSLESLISTIATILNRTPIIINVPAWPLFLLGEVCERICKPLGIEPPIHRRRVAFFTKDRSFNTQKMRTDVDFEYLYTDESGLRQTADWYRARHWI